jgi:hypothetical protein
MTKANGASSTDDERAHEAAAAALPDGQGGYEPCLKACTPDSCACDPRLGKLSDSQRRKLETRDLLKRNPDALSNMQRALGELNWRLIGLAHAGGAIRELANLIDAAPADPVNLLHRAGWIGEQISRCALNLANMANRASMGYPWRNERSHADAECAQ